MKTYQEWLKENRPELLDEGLGKFLSTLAVGGLLGLGAEHGKELWNKYQNFSNPPPAVSVQHQAQPKV